MMLQYSYWIVISVILLFPLSIKSSRYEYLLFENFEVTKTAFIKEQRLVKSLQMMRNDISKRISRINSTINDVSEVRNFAFINKEVVQNVDYRSGDYIKTLLPLDRYTSIVLLNELLYKYHLLKIDAIDLFNYDKHFNLNVKDIMDAAQKGVIMLQETYDQDIKEYSAGHLRFKNGIERKSRQIDSLQPDDLAAMSTMAFNHLHWYDTSLKYLKAAIDKFFPLSKEKRDEFPKALETDLLLMKKQFPSYHNDMFYKKSNLIGPDWKVYPRVVNTDTLEMQSNDTSGSTEFESLLNAIEVDRKKQDYLSGQLREPLFQNVCNGNIKGIGHRRDSEKNIIRPSKCHLVNHFTPFLMLGPFHLEVKMYNPFRTVIHDFFTSKEMNWMLEYSKPRLSASRQGTVPSSTTSLTKSDLRYKDTTKTGYTVSKAVTTWFNDINYNENQQFIQISAHGEPLAYEHPTLEDPYSYEIEHEIMHGISKKIELVSNFNVTTRHGASKYQTTNYGLSGMVVTHNDPWGYEEGVELVEDRHILSRTGDYIATFMGWFEETDAGGNTAFTSKNFEGTVEPIKGSAAFWMNLSSCHMKDARATHGGCPVLKGSKWIVNKWIYSWDQWKKWPCYLQPGYAIRPFEGISS